jgi:hypothetical protein
MTQKEIKKLWNQMKKRLAEEEDIRYGLTCGAAQMRKGTATINIGGMLIIHNKKGLEGRPDKHITTADEIAGYKHDMQDLADWLANTDAVADFIREVGGTTCTVEFKNSGRRVRDWYGRWHDTGVSFSECYMRFHYPPAAE